MTWYFVTRRFPIYSGSSIVEDETIRQTGLPEKKGHPVRA
jgi:hypothetical protein